MNYHTLFDEAINDACPPKVSSTAVCLGVKQAEAML